MRRARLSLLALTTLILVGCSRPPDDTPREPAADPSAAAPTAIPATPAPSADSAATRWDEVTATKTGKISFSHDAHLLRVETSEGVTTYVTSPLKAELTPQEQAALVDQLLPRLRYPAAAVVDVQGVFVRAEGRDGNELVSATYRVSESVRQADALYRGRLESAPMTTHRVATPFGPDEVVVYSTGQGAERYRVVLAPLQDGARVEVTQMFIAGAARQPWDTGQGVLKPVGGEPVKATEPAEGADS